jgi:hypothetical protein
MPAWNESLDSGGEAGLNRGRYNRFEVIPIKSLFYFWTIRG